MFERLTKSPFLAVLFLHFAGMLALVAIGIVLLPLGDVAAPSSAGIFTFFAAFMLWLISKVMPDYRLPRSLGATADAVAKVTFRVMAVVSAALSTIAALMYTSGSPWSGSMLVSLGVLVGANWLCCSLAISAVLTVVVHFCVTIAPGLKQIILKTD